MSACLPKFAQVLEVKQGDTLVLGCTARDAAGDPVPLIGVTVKSQMRSMFDATLAAIELEFAFVDAAAGTYELRYPGSGGVVDCPAGEYFIDIEYRESGGGSAVVRSTRTFYVRVLEKVTS